MVLITERWANGCERVSTTNQQHFNGSNETPEGIALSFGNHAVNLDLNPSEIITHPDGASRQFCVAGFKGSLTLEYAD